MTQMNRYFLESVMVTAWEQEDIVTSLEEEGNVFKFRLRTPSVPSLNAHVLNYNTNQLQQKQYNFAQYNYNAVMLQDLNITTSQKLCSPVGTGL